MDAPQESSFKPAMLMRRLKAPASGDVQKVSPDAAEPLVRCEVEAGRGRVTLSLEGIESGVPILWTQNGNPLRGERGPALHLGGLSADDSDVYFAIVGSPGSETRSQSVLVLVSPGAALVNLSTRGFVTPAKPMIAGFVIGRKAGAAPNKLCLIRVVGESLRKFGVTEVLARPVVSLRNGDASCQELLRTSDPGLIGLQQKVGAFALEVGTAEFAAIAELPPGRYSLIVSSGDGEAGEVLVELYEAPG